MARRSEVQHLCFLPGQRLLCSSGEYSGYYVHGCYEVVHPFDTQTFQAFSAAMSPQERETDRWHNRAFLDCLVTQGVVRVMPMQELYLGDFGEAVFMVAREWKETVSS